MSNITQVIATDISKKLTEKKFKVVAELQEKFSKEVTSLIKAKIPVEILEFYNKHPSYFKTSKSYKLEGNGFNYLNVNTTDLLPVNQLNFTAAYLPTEKEADKLIKIHNELETKKSEAKKLKEEIFTALLSLRTYNKVISEFPEAAEYLPKRIPTSLAVNLTDIRAKL